MTWKCIRGGGCEYRISRDCAVVCVCAALEINKITEAEIEKLKQIETLRVRRAIEASLPKLVEALNKKEAV